MEKEEMQNKIQESFFELAPNCFEETLKAAQDVQSQKPVSDKIVEMPKRNYAKQIVAVACVLAICILAFAGVGNRFKKQDYIVMLDVNPGLKLMLNQSYEVKEIMGTNEDGVALLQHIHLKEYQSVSEVLDIVFSSMIQDSYLHDDSAILLTMQEDMDEAQMGLLNEIESILREEIDKNHLSNVTFAIQRADVSHIASGRQTLEERLLKQGKRPEDMTQLSMKELLLLAQELDKTSVEYIAAPSEEPADEPVVSLAPSKDVKDQKAEKEAEKKLDREDKGETMTQEKESYQKNEKTDVKSEKVENENKKLQQEVAPSDMTVPTAAEVPVEEKPVKTTENQAPASDSNQNETQPKEESPKQEPSQNKKQEQEKTENVPAIDKPEVTTQEKTDSEPPQQVETVPEVKEQKTSEEKKNDSSDDNKGPNEHASDTAKENANKKNEDKKDKGAQ